MKYNKPEIVALGDAVQVIQTSTCKIDQNVLDHDSVKSTTPAYEADE